MDFWSTLLSSLTVAGQQTPEAISIIMSDPRGGKVHANHPPSQDHRRRRRRPRPGGDGPKRPLALGRVPGQRRKRMLDGRLEGPPAHRRRSGRCASPPDSSSWCPPPLSTTPTDYASKRPRSSSTPPLMWPPSPSCSARWAHVEPPDGGLGLPRRGAHRYARLLRLPGRHCPPPRPPA
jgi:hypothetical protein